MKHFRVIIRILNTTFENLCNVHVLLCKINAKFKFTYTLDFVDCKFQKNMFAQDLMRILVHGGSIRIANSVFYKNVNISSIIAISKLDIYSFT